MIPSSALQDFVWSAVSQVWELQRILRGDPERIEIALKAYQPQRTNSVLSLQPLSFKTMHGGHGIGGRAQSDVPYHQFVR